MSQVAKKKTTNGKISWILEDTIDEAPVDDGDYVRRNAGWVEFVGSAPEGTSIKSTGETGGNKYLREDGDGTCSWQTAGGTFAGTMDDITNGSTYVKTHNDFTDAEKTKLSGLGSSPTSWGKYF